MERVEGGGTAAEREEGGSTVAEREEGGGIAAESGVKLKTLLGDIMLGFTRRQCINCYLHCSIKHTSMFAFAAQTFNDRILLPHFHVIKHMRLYLHLNKNVSKQVCIPK